MVRMRFTGILNSVRSSGRGVKWGRSLLLNLAGASVSNRWSKPYKAEILSSRVNGLKTLNRATFNLKTFSEAVGFCLSYRFLQK